MAELRDKPRPDTFWPGTPSQWTQPTVDDCTWYATEFGFEAGSNVHRSMHPVKDIRNHSSDTVGGTPLHVALRETARIWPDSDGVRYSYGLKPRVEIRRALKDDKTILWGGDYEKLPSHYRRWTYNDTFDHAMASRGFRTHQGVEQTFLYDPLGGGRTFQPYDGEWIALSALYDFSWGSGTSEYVGIIWGPGNTQQGDGDKMIKGTVERSSSKYIDLPKGTKVYDTPNGKVVRTTHKDLRVDYMGYSGGWWMVEIWVTDGLVLAYVKKGAGDRGNWPPVPEPEPIDPNPELEARILELENALTNINVTAETALADDE